MILRLQKNLTLVLLPVLVNQNTRILLSSFNPLLLFPPRPFPVMTKGSLLPSLCLLLPPRLRVCIVSPRLLPPPRRDMLYTMRKAGKRHGRRLVCVVLMMTVLYSHLPSRHAIERFRNEREKLPRFNIERPLCTATFVD